VKNILAWVKSNLLVVIFCAVILLALPASYVGASMWRAGILDGRKKEAESEYSTASKFDVTYTLPSYAPAGTPVEVKSAPNAKLTEWFKAQRTRLQEASGAVVKRADDFNLGVGPDAAAVGRSEFKPFVDGLFPSAAAEAEKQLVAQRGKEAFDALAADLKDAAIKKLAGELAQPKLNDMEDALLGKRGRPNPYEALLAQAKAGSAADPVRVADALRDMSAREMEKVTAGKRPLTQEEQTSLDKQLAERRLAEYQTSAKGISVYATLESMPDGKTGSSIPKGKIDPDKIEPISFFLYQWDYWAIQDVFAAVRLANTDAGKLTDVEHSIVKRIESIQIADPKGLFGTPETVVISDLSAPAATPAAAAPGMVPLDPTVSITGRDMSAANPMYDVRRVTLTVVVSSSRLTEFLDAITRTNFMSVTDLDLASVDVWEDLKQGYYYGQENVVRATVQIETIWLRSWMTKYMPHEILTVLSGSSGGAAADPAAAAAPAAPAPGKTGRGRAPGRG